MKWWKLKENKCPKCGRGLEYEESAAYLFCDCGFRISEKKFRSIISKQVSDDIDNDRTEEGYDEYGRTPGREEI